MQPSSSFLATQAEPARKNSQLILLLDEDEGRTRPSTVTSRPPRSTGVACEVWKGCQLLSTAPLVVHDEMREEDRTNAQEAALQFRLLLPFLLAVVAVGLVLVLMRRCWARFDEEAKRWRKEEEERGKR